MRNSLALLAFWAFLVAGASAAERTRGNSSARGVLADALPKIDGKELDLNLTHNYKSPFMQNKVGGNIVTVRYGSRRWDYDFKKNTVTEIAR
jgi:hypothetical protein